MQQMLLVTSKNSLRSCYVEISHVTRVAVSLNSIHIAQIGIWGSIHAYIHTFVHTHIDPVLKRFPRHRNPNPKSGFVYVLKSQRRESSNGLHHSSPTASRVGSPEFESRSKSSGLNMNFSFVNWRTMFITSGLCQTISRPLQGWLIPGGITVSGWVRASEMKYIYLD